MKMTLKRLSNFETSWERFRDAIQRGTFEHGDLLQIGDSDWKVLESTPGDLFIWKAHGPGEDIAFNENGSNKYEGSDLQKYAREIFTETVPAELREMVTEEGFFPLSLEEVKKYLPTEGERIHTDENGDTCWLWTRSANRGTANYPWHVTSSGGVYTSYASSANRFAPACHLKA